MMYVHPSLGSQPQERPQASRAQTAPKIRVKVQHTKAIEWIRKLSASKGFEVGRRSSTRSEERRVGKERRVRGWSGEGGEEAKGRERRKTSEGGRCGDETSGTET